MTNREKEIERVSALARMTSRNGKCAWVVCESKRFGIVALHENQYPEYKSRGYVPLRRYICGEACDIIGGTDHVE